MHTYTQIKNIIQDKKIYYNILKNQNECKGVHDEQSIKTLNKRDYGYLFDLQFGQ